MGYMGHGWVYALPRDTNPARRILDYHTYIQIDRYGVGVRRGDNDPRYHVSSLLLDTAFISIPPL